jgi:hypothetical protein
MKKLILIACVALAPTAAMAFGPSTSDPHPPGALFQSKPGPAAHASPMSSAPVSMRNGRAHHVKTHHVKNWRHHDGMHG